MHARAAQGFFKSLSPIGLVQTLYGHRDLLSQFTVRNFKAKHQGSHLGLSWAVLNPLLLLGLYFTVFGLIFKGKFGVLPDETPVDFALALLLGLTVFHFVSEVINQAPAMIVGNPNLVKKVVFPLEVLPVANLGSGGVNLLVSLLLVTLGQILFGRGLPVTALWVPVIVLPVVLMAAGLGWLLSSLGVFFRDISQITQFASLLLMYASAVFYPAEHLPDQLWTLLRFNPLIYAIELLRDVMLWNETVNLLQLSYLYAAGAGICLLGYATFASLRSTFSDVL